MFKYFNDKIKKLKWFDLKTIGWGGCFIGLFLATIWDKLTTISFWWYLIAAIILYGYFYFRLLKK